jgi:hypothetical protein
MKTRLWCGIAAVAATLTWMSPATASAQARQRYPNQTSQSMRVAYDYGYREGLTNGERDGRSGRAFDYARDRAYQRGDSGYYGAYGDRDRYRDSFRQGYAEGYRAGYARYGRSAGWYDPRDSRGYGYGAYSRGPGFDRGYRDGYEDGRDAGHDNDRYDPHREKHYREGDDGYNRRYGSKDDYKQSYRQGFLEGYDRGYRETRSSRTGRGWPW